MHFVPCTVAVRTSVNMLCLCTIVCRGSSFVPPTFVTTAITMIIVFSRKDSDSSVS